MVGSSDPVKVSVWRDRFERFEVSEKKTAQFCADEGISVANFYAFIQIVDRKDGQIVKQYPRKTEQLLFVDPACYEGNATERVAAPRPLGKMARKLEEIAAMSVEQRSIDIYAQVAEVAR